MANQTMDKKVVVSAPRTHLEIRILVVLGILALVIVTARSLANQSVTPDISNGKVFEQTFSTQQYWDKAADYEARKAAMEAAPESSATFSTQQYWDKAAEYEASKAAAIGAPATFSTQQYWDKAAEYEASKAASNKPEASEEPEWSYYTEQYWSKTR